jgi:hypothetical protein
MVCGTSFEAERSDAKTCSDNCRKIKSDGTLSEAELWLRLGMKSLTDKQRFVLERAWGLTDGKVYSFREIAGFMGLSSHNAVFEHYKRAVNRLREVLPEGVQNSLRVETPLGDDFPDRPAYGLEGLPTDDGGPLPDWRKGGHGSRPPQGVRLSPGLKAAFAAIDKAIQQTWDGTRGLGRKGERMQTSAPTIAERVTELELEMARQKAQNVEVARQLGLRFDDERVQSAVEDFIRESLE